MLSVSLHHTAQMDLISHSKPEPQAESTTNRRVSTMALNQSSDAKNENNHSRYTEEELKVIEKLKVRDREVRAHEAAHASVGGQYAGSPSYTFQQGPDGRNYAIGGKVAIDISKVTDDPQATIQKMEQVARAALAPAEPSNADKQIAQKARSKKLQAQQEIRNEAANDAKQNSETPKVIDNSNASLNSKFEVDQPNSSTLLAIT